MGDARTVLSVTTEVKKHSQMDFMLAIPCEKRVVRMPTT